MKKTVLINCSPKRKLSVSGFIMRCAGLMVRGEKEYLHLRTPSDRQAVLEALKTAGQVVFAIPLYVDGVPSHMLPFMKEMEACCRENGLRLKVYVIANNGFIEGRQNEPLMQVMENFCTRSGLEWCGGIGIGGGVMLNVERIMIAVMFGLMLLNMLLRGIRGEKYAGTGPVLRNQRPGGNAPGLRDYRLHRPPGAACESGYGRRKTVYPDHAALFCLHSVRRHLLYDCFRSAGRNFQGMVFPVQTGRRLQYNRIRRPEISGKGEDRHAGTV